MCGSPVTTDMKATTTSGPPAGGSVRLKSTSVGLHTGGFIGATIGSCRKDTGGKQEGIRGSGAVTSLPHFAGRVFSGLEESLSGNSGLNRRKHGFAQVEWPRNDLLGQINAAASELITVRI